MRILVLNWKDLTHPQAGGAEVYTHEITRRWTADGHEVTWFSAGHPGARADETNPHGVRLVRRGGRYGVYRAARDWYTAPGAGRFDLVIDEVNTRPFGAVRWADAPVVALIHQVAREIWHHVYPWPAAAVGRWVLEPAWLRAYRDSPVITVSPSSRDSLAGYGLRRMWTVPAGIAARGRPDVPREERPTLIALGRLAPAKQVDHILRAFAHLREDGFDGQLWVVGDGPAAARLRRIAPPATTFHGLVDRAERDSLLARAHVHVCASVREGWALTVDEAAAMGTPTLAYDRPGLRDSVPAARGVLVRPTPRALADGIGARLPEWIARPAAHGWPGGARPWDEVADRVLAVCLHATGAGTAPATNIPLPSNMSAPTNITEPRVSEN